MIQPRVRADNSPLGQILRSQKNAEYTTTQASYIMYIIFSGYIQLWTCSLPTTGFLHYIQYELTYTCIMGNT